MFCDTIDSKCSTCITNYYLYNSQCSSQQPAGTYCSFDQANHYYNCEICSISGCKQCNSIQNQCSTCSSNQFMYNNNCYPSQPAGTNCKLSNDNFFICSQCKQSGCLKCQNNINECSSCSASQFLFNFKCYDQQPPGTICDQNGGNQQNYNYQNCAIQGCKDCNTNINQCSSCQSGEYFYDSQCFKKQPNSTYCSNDSNAYSCKNCLNQQCLSCDSSLLKCISCVYYLFEGNCYKNQPENTYCDHNTRICNQCLNQSCKTCQSNLSICQSCPNQYYLFLGLCTKEQPSNTYCDQENNCFKCKDSSCKTCDQSLQICQTCLAQAYLYNNYCQSILESGCNISCGVCYGIDEDQCVSCSSETRIYKKDSTTCECKGGFSEVFEVDCEQNIKAVYDNNLESVGTLICRFFFGFDTLLSFSFHNNQEGMSLTQSQFVQSSRIDNQLVGISTQIMNPQVTYTAISKQIRDNSNFSQTFWLIIELKKMAIVIAICFFSELKPLIINLQNMILIISETLFIIASSIDYVLIEGNSYNSTYQKVLETVFMAIISVIQVSIILMYIRQIYKIFLNKYLKYEVRRKRLDSPQSPLKNPSQTIQLENMSTFKLKTASAYEDTYKVQFQNLPSKSYQPKLVRRQLSVFSQKIV
ncbi:hypothetical protein ABPG72_019484 [Tetrahymena utriculariae]